MNEPPGHASHGGRGMALATLACAAMCGLPLVIAGASVLASPLFGPAALLAGGLGVWAVLVWRRRRPRRPRGHGQHADPARRTGPGPRSAAVTRSPDA